MSERRSAVRRRKAFSLVFSNSSNEYHGISSDFSASGLFIITREPLSPGTVLRIRLDISGDRSIHLRGVVIRTIKTGDLNIKDGMGVKLNDAPHSYHSFIESVER